MALRIICPGCGKVHRMLACDATRRLVCPTCLRGFVPVEDSEVPCPLCGSVVSLPYRTGQRSVRCLNCGFVLGEPSILERRRRVVVVLTATIMTAVALLVISLAALSP